MKAFCTNCREPRQAGFNERNARCPECGFPLTSPPRDRATSKGLKANPDKPLRSKRGNLRQRQPARDWTLARAKVELEATCRFCGRQMDPERLHACHIIGRERDAFHPVTFEPLLEPWPVVPERIVPGEASCHAAYDDHEIDLIGKLTLEEELQAIRDCYPPTGRGSGIEEARQRCAPKAYRRELAA